MTAKLTITETDKKLQDLARKELIAMINDGTLTITSIDFKPVAGKGRKPARTSITIKGYGK